MATYATQADFEAYVEGWVTDDPAALERLLERAERDVDLIFGPIAQRTDTGLKLDPSSLLAWEAKALSNAVCAQAQWRFEHPGDLDTPAAQNVSGPDFSVTYVDRPAGATNRYSPRVALELAPIRHLRSLTARVMP